ncbi:oxygen-independent coproporphyrinogen-3 oxidase [Cognatiyoonia sediminum]|uniref:Heme chaperone HemW n=1 Tax=Cognatiyoonia sediminum TaxID=1508389 RepID=A0A1M5QN22_9RHOB|nr:radical SAM family heme chaperone HemW [Cognatiyoonia sediminum]SHH15504.1 oxygen-independent coproporphyrinogen-3 oxidase [Cognatiyoonia sediminum]
MTENWQRGGFGLYVHWPFCEAKCPYCDFNSYVSQSIDHDRWKAAYLSELNRVGSETPDRVLTSIFFGGGTPSLMEPSVVEEIIKTAGKLWPFTNDIEITIEANPSSVEAERFKGFQAGGVNRVSLGVQALNDTDLKALGRLHSVKEAREAIEIAQNTFERASFDLIYARQNQTLSQWESELSEAVAIGTDHLSLYQLTIEQGTAFGDRHKRGMLRGLPSEDLGADMYFATQDICEAAGLPAYETSNHARTGEESRHNQIYWRSGDYVGIGPGAHGRVTLNQMRLSTESFLAPGEWLKSVEDLNSGESERDPLDLGDQKDEFLLMGLRMSEGVDLSVFDFSDKYNEINNLSELGLVDKKDDTLRVTPQGRPLLNSILARLV